MLFEWDERKSRKNLERHGISFDEVVYDIEKNGIIVTLVNPARAGQRLMVFRGKGGKIHAAVAEERNGKMRLITAQRRRKMEKLYGP